MPTENQYDKILDNLADNSQRRLLNALTDLENQVADLMGDAPLRDGQLFDLEWAVQARPAIRAALDDAYLSEVNAVVGSYEALAEQAQDMLSTYGDFTKLDTTVIRQLQQLSFQGFESVALEYVDVLANEVYQSTLVGRSFNDTVKNLRQTINGVYIQSDDVEAQRLVDIVNNGTVAEANAAAETLRTKFARDRAGNNLRRYASQMAQDSLMQFDASINTRIGIESGATKWKYYGDVIRDSRPFCKKHAGKVFTLEEIEETWAGSWKGKAAGDPFIVRGGYNCRHHWRPIFDTEDIPETEEEAPELNASLPVGVPPLRKKKDVQKEFDERSEAANVKGSKDPTGTSANGYVVNSDGDFVTRFNHGWTRRSPLTRYEYDQKIISGNDFKGFTAETLSLIQPSIAETDRLAAVYGVPKIRAIHPTKQKNAVADMGDGSLGLNKQIYNGYGKQAYSSAEELVAAETAARRKLDNLLDERKEIEETFRPLRARLLDGDMSVVPEYNEVIAAYSANKKAIKAAEKATAEASKLAAPMRASTYKRGDNLADRGWAAGYYFDTPELKARATILHEFGHNVHHQYFANQLNLRKPPLEVWLESKFGKGRFYPTQYSEANPREWFAENFALYNMGRKDLVDDEIKGLLDAMVKADGRLEVYDGFDFVKGEYI